MATKPIQPDLMPDWAKKAPEKAPQKLGMFQFQTKIVWFNAIGFLVMHLIGLYGFGVQMMLLYNFQVANMIWLSLLIFFGGEGITIGAHRLWTHKSFKAKLPLQVILITFQTLAGQNCCYIWARDHRQHHKYSDTDADPHNAHRGFFFSHIGWLMMKKHPEVIRKGKDIDMSDLEANPVIMFQKKYYKPLYVIFALIIPVFIPMYLWDMDLWTSFIINFLARTIILLNITWCVNSVAHMFGTRPYDRNIVPVESPFVSFIGMGEGWHNYHHAFPWDYKASEYGMYFNGTTKIIEAFAKVGWAYDMREASHSMMTSRIQRCGDGSHPQHKHTILDDGPDKQERADSDTESCEPMDTSFVEVLARDEALNSMRKGRTNKRQAQNRRNRIRHG